MKRIVFERLEIKDASELKGGRSIALALVDGDTCKEVAATRPQPVCAQAVIVSADSSSNAIPVLL
jgi:hypothetical protein